MASSAGKWWFCKLPAVLFANVTWRELQMPSVKLRVLTRLSVNAVLLTKRYSSRTAVLKKRTEYFPRLPAVWYSEH